MTSKNSKPYSGRLIFDHFPKTAGQSINRWLTDVLGGGTVSANLMCTHRDLISYGSDFPILSGHIFFAEGERLDARYQYATLLREPVDRTLSSLYFVTRNHRREQLPELYDECQAFLDSDGDEIGPQLSTSIVNPMTEHFAQIKSERGSPCPDPVEAAMGAIEDYDCVGIYERLDEFVASLATLIGIPSPSSLRSVNATAARPAVEEISDKLRDKLLLITDLDRQLHARVSQLVAERLAAKPPSPPKRSRWVRYERSPPRLDTTAALTLHKVRAHPGRHVRRGGVVRFELDFELHEPVGRLTAGLHILDDRQRWAFGINNGLLGQTFESLPIGRHRLVHTLTADLPSGTYTVGFSFADAAAQPQRDLFWSDESVALNVTWPPGAIGVGYAHCYAEIVLDRAAKPVTGPVEKLSGATA